MTKALRAPRETPTGQCWYMPVPMGFSFALPTCCHLVKPGTSDQVVAFTSSTRKMGNPSLKRTL
jgi:hypothetical protein